MKNNYKKLSKAAVATVLASSGILVALPPAANAYVFKDLNPNADYYKPVLDLVNRGVISGYSDGTFRPSEAVTRGEAAKIMALAMGLNVTRQKNPGFTDVQQSHPYYAYIAAIANEGIIDGFGDKTFKPNELITRGQIAKALTLGFQLEVATKMNHNFKDVTSQNANEAYIQTLYNLHIAKGTTANTFEPFGTVTRAQLATFIWRVEKADKGNPSYNVGDIRGDIIYINGVQYTIGSSLKSFINEGNAAALKGAVIDGTFNGKTLTGIRELTLNASGTATRLVALDGGGANFNGELTINGTYLRVKNMKLNGRTTIAEVPRKSLADYTQRIQGLNVASISGVGFIDWSQPNVPDNDGYLNPKDNEVLKPVPDKNARPNTRYSARMSKVDGYVDFEDTYVSNLFIERNNTFVSADYTLSRVTIARDVEQAEIYADMTTMYIETERNLVLYGVHNIETVYKNNYKSVYFNTDSFIDFLYVDNSSGWIDLGEHVYIDRVILPKDKKPNQIFDDFENDNDKIGNITDPDGKPVDREEEDKDIPDETRPIVVDLDVLGEGTSATATFTSNEDGTYYWLERKASERPPTIREVLQANQEKRGTVKANTPTSFAINNLEEETDYILYLVVVDDAGNVSEKAEAEFSTTDGTPPRVLNLRAEPMHGGQRAKFFFTPSEPGDYYYFIRRATTAADPTTADIIANPTGTGRATSRDAIEQIIGGLEANIDYEIYVVMRDRSSNISENPPAKTTVTTSAIDNIHPYVSNPELVRHSDNQFYLYVNERLDPETANNIENYDLSGSVIINIDGQQTIKPSAVEYQENGNRPRVLLTIPSQTGFVNGDTLRVTVLPGVKDLAGLDFENVRTLPPNSDVPPRNYATYTHTDTVEPVITRVEITKNAGSDLAKVDYHANKAGLTYYLIMPNTTDLGALGIDEQDFYNEFIEKPSGKFDTTTSDSGKIYIGGLKAAKPTEVGIQDFNIDLSSLTLDPFTTYDLFMVLRDRSGKLSKIVRKEIIADTKPPLIYPDSIKVTPIGGENVAANRRDREATLSFHSLEAGTVYYKAIEKWVVDDPITGTMKLNPLIYDASGNLKPIEGTTNSNRTNAEREAAFRAIGGVANERMGNGDNNLTIRNLTPHQEYVLYMGVKDTHGNFTVYSMNDANPPSDLNQPNGTWIRQEFYSDGTKPKIEDHLIYRNTDGTFTITFSEAIMRQKYTGNTSGVSKEDLNKSLIPATGTFDLSTIFDITNEAGNPITSEYEFVSYTVGTSTSNQSRLVFKPSASGTMDKTITIKMKDMPAAYDYQGQNAFDLEDFGQYIYPGTVENTIMGASVTGTNIGLPGVEASKTMRTIVYIEAEPSYKQRYYYAVTNSATTINPQTVINLVEGRSTDSGPILVFGSDLLPESSPADRQFTLNLRAPAATGSSNPVFTVGNNFFIFTVDRFGNIVWAVDSNDTSKQYRKLTDAIGLPPEI
ncbi:S-layer homology domain-containing protein [Metasolibacillus meyeri]|uniref:S-layer homology domain-containing protein n=1 Tax=Metasolibacillus meyeri TaxID=1071052 RepID=A0AAW9NT36_9BACL|nr:S-layer homology domain-containing protein [Metasolibacillus meyeri]MEC1179556.1 S-layer homology domain-containing protein [Metasolibacillus meyeri]